ncbi:hypothetical protein Sarmat_00587 [Rickettsiales endosymbiont of Paramecium tredecaurelia]|uniref:rRNA maturation RNase YbeY n=1 Tax=Candidatus Sarmatiella mevalonica TaxID=2770581 RepID=UPI001921C36C|nr:rRNA maturation RNase YbeY [Candidatus Sarmatiella mevalonica]MBL3284732.1 hypothetical protein [Candidatus Sarmatiella mevalonica]
MLCAVKINKKDKRWSGYKQINKSLVVEVIRSTFSIFPLATDIKKIEVSLLLTNAQEMHELNKNFRGKDKPTNVLSFPDKSYSWHWLSPKLQKSLDDEYIAGAREQLHKKYINPLSKLAHDEQRQVAYGAQNFERTEVREDSRTGATRASPSGVEFGEMSIETPKFDDYIYLGDIAFGYEVLLQEAQDCLFDMQSYFIHLLIHSLLHLVGFDHTTNQDALVMESHEELVLKKFNIRSPYSENFI